MLFKPNPSSGVPIYLQLMEQIKHAVEVGALRAGEQLPAMRKVAEELVMNPNTVAKAYRELEHDGVIELRQGSGAFVAENYESRTPAAKLRQAQIAFRTVVARLIQHDFSEEEMRRLFEAELTRLREGGSEGHKG